MMKALPVIAVLLACLTPAHAQWSGKASVDGGWNFLESNSENASFGFKYTGKKFYIGANLSGGHSYLPSKQETSILDGKKEGNEFYKGEEKSMNLRTGKARAGIDFGFKIDPVNTLDFSVGYAYKGKEDYPVLSTERYGASSSETLNGVQRDTIYETSHGLDGKIVYNHSFESRPDAKLSFGLSSQSDFSTKYNNRVTNGNFYSRPKHYATLGSLNGFDNKLSSSYDDKFRIGESTLKMKTGIDLSVKENIDLYSAETMVNGHWKDSTEYRQSYLYYALSAEPYVNLSYTIGKFDFFVKERLQWYKHTLIDKLENIKKPEDVKGLFDKQDWMNLLGAGITYRISDRHRLAFDYSRTISRPEYKKLCTTLTIGSSEGEYFIGNPDLLPEVSDKLNLNYVYTKGIFVTSLDINYRIKKDTAEKVIDLEHSKDIKDPGVKTIYTWINNKRQNSFGTKLDLKMNGRDIKAGIWAGLNYDMFGNNEKMNKEDFNYELGTVINVFLNETTELSSTLAYISDKQSAYNLKGEDVIANLRLTKSFAKIKGLDVYAEIHDLVDKDLYEETWNAERTYLKVSTTQLRQRLVILGVNYRF